MSRVPAPVVHTKHAHLPELTARPLRIVLAPSAYYPHIGGIEELTRQLGLVLAARGHKVALLTNRWPSSSPREETLDGLRVSRLAFPLPSKRLGGSSFVASGPKAGLDLARYLGRTRPEIVHVIGGGPQSAYLSFFARPFGARVVFTAQGELGFDARDVFRHSASLRLGLRRILRHADAVTACSGFVLRELEGFSPITAEHSVIPNGVNPDDFTVAEESPAASRRVVAVGRLVPQKGFDMLVRAFADDALRSLQLVIVGEGPERDRLARLAADLAIGERVTLLGPLDREALRSALAGAHIFALPSRGEPFGIALLEAMAAGVPAVATDAGGIIEFAQDQVNALLVPPDDAKALATAIARLASDDALRVRLSVAGRRTAEALSWESIATRYEDVYRKLVVD